MTELNLRKELTNEFGDDYNLSEDTATNEWVISVNEIEMLRVDKGTSIPQEPEIATLPTAAGTTPYYPSDKFTKVKDTDLTTGLVITDAVDGEGISTGNEYVWIEVPNKKLDSSATFGPDYAGNSVSGSIDYANIEKAMIAYVKDGLLNGSEDNLNAYKNTRRGWKDEWYDGKGKTATGDNASSNLNDTTGCGLTSEKYTELYHKMLKSVYENGGFWIGRYEAGMAGNTERANADVSIDGVVPLSKQDLIPIFYVTCSQAQTIATRVENKGTYNSSLMFGIQWDMVLKYLQNKGVAVHDLTSDSSSWGNYQNQTITITSGRYYSPYSNPTAGFIELENGSFTKSGEPRIFSTGIIPNSMARKNIYDLAGNMFEFTLEHSTYVTDSPCAIRGGRFSATGSNDPASGRNNDTTSNSTYCSGFRVSLY